MNNFYPCRATKTATIKEELNHLSIRMHHSKTGKLVSVLVMDFSKCMTLC